MTRPLRIEYEGAFYHVTSRGNEGGRIFFSKIRLREILRPQLSQKITSSRLRGGGLRWGGKVQDVHPSPSQRPSEPAAIPTFPHHKLILSHIFLLDTRGMRTYSHNSKLSPPLKGGESNRLKIH